MEEDFFSNIYKCINYENEKSEQFIIDNKLYSLIYDKQWSNIIENLKVGILSKIKNWRKK